MGRYTFRLPARRGSRQQQQRKNTAVPNRWYLRQSALFLFAMTIGAVAGILAWNMPPRHNSKLLSGVVSFVRGAIPARLLSESIPLPSNTPTTSISHGSPVPAQIVADLSPWGTTGFSAEDISRTRRLLRRSVANSTSLSHGLAEVVLPEQRVVTVTIRRRKAVLLREEVMSLSGALSAGSAWKATSLLSTLTSIAEDSNLPDLQFLYNLDPIPATLLGSSTRSKRAPRGLAPVFSPCKTTEHLDVLSPNPFLTASWSASVERLEQSAFLIPFSKRTPKVWFRGATGDVWRWSEPRVRFLLTWHNRPYADFAVTNDFPTVWRAWRDEGNAPTEFGDDAGTALRHGPSRRMAIHSVASYKYAVHLPGCYRASYSRSLQFLLFTRALVFRLECPYFEYYYRDLVDGVHYLSVNSSNFGERYAWAESHPVEAERIAHAGFQFAQANLSSASVTAYWVSLLRSYAVLQRSVVRMTQPNEFCACSDKGADACPFICDIPAAPLDGGTSPGGCGGAGRVGLQLAMDVPTPSPTATSVWAAHEPTTIRQQRGGARHRVQRSSHSSGG